MGPSSETKSSSCCQMSRLAAELLPSFVHCSRESRVPISFRDYLHLVQGLREDQWYLELVLGSRPCLVGHMQLSLCPQDIRQPRHLHHHECIVSEAAPAFEVFRVIGCSVSGAHGLVCRFGRELQCLSPTGTILREGVRSIWASSGVHPVPADEEHQCPDAWHA